AKKIVQRAESYGIPSSDIYIDCLTLAASAEQDVVLETLKAVSLVKKELGVKTVLGVSNISFGLPNRELINETFLTMALSHGLDLPIMNPNNMGMAGAFDSFKMLLNIDKQASTYIARHNGQKAAEPTKAETKNILYAIHKGLKADARILTEELLKTENPMEIINEKLIPALDDVGTKFERGEIFLPQLMASAEAAQEAFAVIRSKLSQEQNEQKSFGTIVLATVKGDIHDIGKNIVKVLLQNYGYDVIDLGRDVPPKTVVQAAKEHEAKLVGLSALMTTTLDAMEETIKLLHIEIPNCKVMVGGAVLTEDYALKIGADFYSKDAKMGIDIAKKVFNNN
ncbi:MAG: cobalamin-dependent protein, partial [Bacillota bacterium]|nr:cobalamin-dependent protein [Bacillota bacterium]